uniref:Uncharacterized protein n=1 Tax=Pyxicephalus adspersus TaxID=30357 RepID=A0AAV3B992_PYXAD|nr:TPA: hypothetical protein GDO54_000394 [Pyxicephalus adspersus]
MGSTARNWRKHINFFFHFSCKSLRNGLITIIYLFQVHFSLESEMKNFYFGTVYIYMQFSSGSFRKPCHVKDVLNSIVTVLEP